MTNRPVHADLRVYAAVAAASAAVVALQLVLIRCLAIARWHHFAYLVISTALLGFGVSGTVLTLVGRRLAARFKSSMLALLIGLAVSTSSCLWLAEALPIDIYQVMLRPSQAGLLMVYHLILMGPFLLGALAIGLPLTTCRDQVPSLYAVNLMGSGLGAAIAVGLMVVLRAEHLLGAVSVLGMAAALFVAVGSLRRLSAWVFGALLNSALVGVFLRPIPVDPYKPLAYYRQLVGQGNARHLAERHSPRARVDVFDSPLAHETLFASPQACPPPPQLLFVIDGGLTAPIFRITHASQAGVMDETPLAAIYRTFRPRRVLLLGELGGADVWLARRFQADHITVVQPNPQVVELLRGPLARSAGDVLEGPDIRVVTAELRGFLDRTTERFDLIQLVALESLAAGAPGLMALNESSLATVEGFARCLDRLAPGGVVAVVRGIQEPPRDNIRLFATFVEALERRGRSEPGGHLVQFRNYLAACTVAAADPLTPDRIRRLTETLSDMGLDPVWYPGMPDDQANRIDPRPGPPGSPLSFLDWAVREILSPRRSAFYDAWSFAVRPATDDQPFFFDFFRWRSLPTYIQRFGPYWLARVEWGYVVLIAALGWTTVVAAVLILLPLLWLRSPAGATGIRFATGVYYLALGAGYMLLEISLMQQFTLVLAEPLFAVAVVLAAFLIFSGMGSFWAGRGAASGDPPIRPVILVIVALGTVYAGMGRGALEALVGWSWPVRVGICLLIAGLLAVPMGMPFPRGLIRLSRHAPDLVPWAWAANGFASVVGAVLAMVVAMSFGFATAVWLSVGAYVLAGIVQAGLPGSQARADVGPSARTEAHG